MPDARWGKLRQAALPAKGVIDSLGKSERSLTSPTGGLQLETFQIHSDSRLPAARCGSDAQVDTVAKCTDLRTIAGLITWPTWDMLMAFGSWPYMVLKIRHVDRWFKCLWPHARSSGSKNYLLMKTQQTKSLEGILYNQSWSRCSVCVITCAQQSSLKKYACCWLSEWFQKGNSLTGSTHNLKKKKHTQTKAVAIRFRSIYLTLSWSRRVTVWSEWGLGCANTGCTVHWFSV